MSVTPDQLNQFHEFASTRIAGAGAESLEQLLQLWREETAGGDLAAIRRGVADADAGRLAPLEQAVAEVRRALREQA